jgi:hypothetical protein
LKGSHHKVAKKEARSMMMMMMKMMMMVLIGKLGITMNNKWAGEIMEYIVGWRWLYACPVTGNRIDQTSMAGDQY